MSLHRRSRPTGPGRAESGPVNPRIQRKSFALRIIGTTYPAVREDAMREIHQSIRPPRETV